jgi:hypothetical protein
MQTRYTENKAATSARAKATIEQERRFLERLDSPAKNRKFSSNDARQRPVLMVLPLAGNSN